MKLICNVFWCIVTLPKTVLAFIVMVLGDRPKMYKCNRVDCPMPALWRPVMCVPPLTGYTGKNHPRMMLSMGVCEMHKRTTNIFDYLSDEGKGQILAVMREAGLAEPNFDGSWLDFQVLQRGEDPSVLWPPFKKRE